jgi:hypothetical protein
VPPASGAQRLPAGPSSVTAPRAMPSTLKRQIARQAPAAPATLQTRPGADITARLAAGDSGVMRRLVVMALLLAGPSCQQPPESRDVCEPCARADVCCAARTANADSNCRHLATCLMFTDEPQATVVDGCEYYLRVGSTPPAPAACGPHPDAD